MIQTSFIVPLTSWLQPATRYLTDSRDATQPAQGPEFFFPKRRVALRSPAFNKFDDVSQVASSFIPDSDLIVPLTRRCAACHEVGMPANQRKHDAKALVARVAHLSLIHI